MTFGNTVGLSMAIEVELSYTQLGWLLGNVCDILVVRDWQRQGTVLPTAVVPARSCFV